jgi:hypothetical protein
MREIYGACHCGDVSYVLEWPVEGAPPLRTCDCSFCVKHGGLYTSHPNAALRVTLHGADALSRYEFGHRTAQFCACRRCGVFLFAISPIDGRDRAVLNARTLADFKGPATVPVNSFDGESVDGRLGRRGRNWIGKVTIGVAPA